MSFGDADLAVFFADMGVSITAYNGVALSPAVKAQFDDGYTSEPGADGAMQGIVEATVLTFPTGSISGLAADKTLTADGRNFVTRSPLLRDDGRITVLPVVEVTS